MRRHFSVAMVAACPFPRPLGSQVRIFRMAEALARCGHEVHVVTCHLGDETPEGPFRLHRTARMPMVQSTGPGPSYQRLLLINPLLAAKLRDVLQNEQIDLIHAHHYEGLLVAGWAQGKIQHPIIYDAHTMLESELHCYALGLPRPLSKRIGRWLDRRIPPWADHIVAATTSIRDKLVRHGRCKPEQITVVSTGVEWEHFLTAGDVDAAHPCSPKILVFSGNLAPYQGIPLLFKAFQHIRQVRQDVRLLMLTDSPGVEYRGLAARLGIEQFIDFVDSDFERLPYHLGRADIALNPRAEGDGLPGKLLNYMAAGKPIVSFAGSAHCLIHGKTGWIVDEPNERLFAEAVLHLLQEPALACRLGTNAQVHVQQQYSWNQATDKLEHIYGHVAAIHERLATTRASQQRL